MAITRTQAEWDQLTRNVGRIRLNEPLANELNLILNEEYQRRKAAYFAARTDAERLAPTAPSEEARTTLDEWLARKRRALTLADKLRKANYELLREKGWV